MHITRLTHYTFIHMHSYTFISFAFILPGVYIHIYTSYTLIHLVYTYIHTYTLVYTHIHTHTLVYTHIHTHTLVYTRILSYTHIYTLIHPYTLLYAHIHTLYTSCTNHSFIHTSIIHLCTTVYLVGQLVVFC